MSAQTRQLIGSLLVAAVIVALTSWRQGGGR